MFLIKKLKEKHNSGLEGRVVLRIQMEQNDEVCLEAKAGGKGKGFACAASGTMKRTLAQTGRTLQNVAHNSSCQLNRTVCR